MHEARDGDDPRTAQVGVAVNESAHPMRGDLAAMLYIGDYFADTLHLCAAKHAILQRLLLEAWTRGSSIFDIDLAPDGLSLDGWQSVKATVLPLALNARPRSDHRAHAQRAVRGLNARVLTRAPV